MDHLAENLRRPEAIVVNAVPHGTQPLTLEFHTSLRVVMPDATTLGSKQPKVILGLKGG